MNESFCVNVFMLHAVARMTRLPQEGVRFGGCRQVETGRERETGNMETLCELSTF